MNPDADRIKKLFGGDRFKFARWGVPISPVVIGLDDKGTQLFTEAIEAVADLAGVQVEDIDPEMGANMMVYIMADWAHASRAPNLPKFLPDLPALVERLTEANANRYRVFAFDDQGAIRASITLLRYDEQMQAAPVDYIALSEAVLAIMVYDEAGIADDRPVVMAKFEDDDDARAIVEPWHGMLIHAAYDPALPAGSKDPALAMRLAARIEVQTSPPDPDEDDDDGA